MQFFFFSSPKKPSISGKLYIGYSFFFLKGDQVWINRPTFVDAMNQSTMRKPSIIRGIVAELSNCKDILLEFPSPSKQAQDELDLLTTAFIKKNDESINKHILYDNISPCVKQLKSTLVAMKSNNSFDYVEYSSQITECYKMIIDDTTLQQPTSNSPLVEEDLNENPIPTDLNPLLGESQITTSTNNFCYTCFNKFCCD